MKLVNVVFLDEKLMAIYKDEEDAFEFIGEYLDKDSSSTNFRVEEFELK